MARRPGWTAAAGGRGGRKSRRGRSRSSSYFLSAGGSGSPSGAVQAGGSSSTTSASVTPSSFFMPAVALVMASVALSIAVFEAPQAVYVYQLLGFQPAPLDLAAATPLITGHLARQESDRVMRAELQLLRAAASIEVYDAPTARAAAPERPGT